MNIAWVFLFATALLIPLIFIMTGWIFMKYTPPYSRNALFGYRTKMSKLNQDTWGFAHKYFGKVALVLGVVMLPLTILPFIGIINSDGETVALVGTVVILIQTVVLLCSILPTERALKEEFDEWGYRR